MDPSHEDGATRLMRVLRTRARQPCQRLEGASREEVVSQLHGMMGGGKVVLLEGPAGSGKSVAVALACARLAERKLVVTMSGRAVAEPEEVLAGVAVGLGATKKARVEMRQMLTFRLAELKREGRFVVIVMHDCELCVGETKQSLLYMMLDLMQDPDVKYTLVLTTRTQDFVDRLEKRVQSRLGSQRVVMPSLSVAEAEAVVRSVLTPPPEEAEWDWWRQVLRRMDLTSAVAALHRVQCSNVRYFVNFAWLVLANRGSVQAARDHMMKDAWRARIESLSEVELCVLVVMLRPTSGGTPTTLDDAYNLYKKELTQANENVFPKKLFQRAFLNLREIADWPGWPLPVVKSVIDDDAANSLPTYMRNFLRGFA